MVILYNNSNLYVDNICICLLTDACNALIVGILCHKLSQKCLYLSLYEYYVLLYSVMLHIVL